MTEAATAQPATTETVEEFRLRARDWLAANMPRKAHAAPAEEGAADDAEWQRARELQGILFGGGFAGLCYPKEYGGQGLSYEYQVALDEESAPYEWPYRLNAPSLSICGPTLMDMGSEEQKLEFLPKVISGEIVLCQFLSEPTGGSDLAGLLTRADRVDDHWVLNGSKIWSTSAYAADYAMCLARTNWDVPKHQGLTMFLLKVHQSGIEMHRIEMINGGNDFCQEFFTDVVVPDSAVVGEVDDGWTVASRQLRYERQAPAGSPYHSGAAVRMRSKYSPELTLVELAKRNGVDQEPWARDLIAEAEIVQLLHPLLGRYVADEVAAERLPDIALTYVRGFRAQVARVQADAGLAIAGAAGVTHGSDDAAGEWGLAYLSRQAMGIGGGTEEMSLNVISERVLGMPRERADDKDIPFREVRRGPA